MIKAPHLTYAWLRPKRSNGSEICVEVSFGNKRKHFCDNLKVWSSVSSLYNNDIAKLVTLADFQGKSTKDWKKKENKCINSLLGVPCWYSVFGKGMIFVFVLFSLGIHPALCIHPIHEKNNLYFGSMLKSSSVCGARPSPHHRFYKASQVHWTRSTLSLDKAKAAEWRWTIKFCLCCSPYYENTLAFFSHTIDWF